MPAITNDMYGCGYYYGSCNYGALPSGAASGQTILLWDKVLRRYVDQAGNPMV